MTVFRIIVPPIVCVLCLFLTDVKLFYYWISFGLVIGFLNWDSHKYHPLLGVVLSLLVSCVVFYLSYYSLVVTSKIFDFLGDLGSVIAIIISAFILAPLLLFFSYKFVFNLPKTKLKTTMIIISVVVLVLYSYISLSYGDLTEIKILNPYVVWQIVMALALQIIINQKLIKAKSNNMDSIIKIKTLSK